MQFYIYTWNKYFLYSEAIFLIPNLFANISSNEQKI